MDLIQTHGKDRIHGVFQITGMAEFLYLNSHKSPLLHPASQCMLSCVQLSGTLWAVAPARLLCPWNFPGKKTEIGCHFLLLDSIFFYIYISRVA